MASSLHQNPCRTGDACRHRARSNAGNIVSQFVASVRNYGQIGAAASRQATAASGFARSGPAAARSSVI
jgi:hypothetical protein